MCRETCDRAPEGATLILHLLVCAAPTALESYFTSTQGLRPGLPIYRACGAPASQSGSLSGKNQCSSVARSSDHPISK